MRKKTIAAALITAGMMCFNALPSKVEACSYKAPESNGIEQNIEHEYGEIKKIRVINIRGKDNHNSINDEVIEKTYKDGTIVTTHGFSFVFGPRKIIERTKDGKNITEKYDRYDKSWRLTDRIVKYKSGDTSVEDWYGLNAEDTGIEIKRTRVEKETKEGKTIEWYWGNRYYEDKKPDAKKYVSEKIIYPKGTTVKESYDYFKDQSKFFDVLFYNSIERKVIEEKNEEGTLTMRRFVTILKYHGIENYEKRIEQDYDLSQYPSCDGKIDMRQKITNYGDRVCTYIDLDGDNKADEETCEKVITIHFDKKEK